MGFVEMIYIWNVRKIGVNVTATPLASIPFYVVVLDPRR